MFRFLGGVFLVIGAVIGGGIIAIPIVSAKYGFLTTLSFIILAWMIMTKTGLYILALSIRCPEKFNSYYSIVGQCLGRKMQFVTSIMFLWLLYFSLASYLSGSASIILNFAAFSPTFLSYFSLSLLVVLGGGALIIIGTNMIIRLNVVFVTLKLGLLITAICFSFPHYAPFPIGSLPHNQTGIWSLFLIIINGFGFHFIIPSLVSYYGRSNYVSLKKVLICSTTIVLLLYILWLCTIYAIIPASGKHGLISIFQSPNQLVAFNNSLLHFMHEPRLNYLLSAFEGVALFGSFFCVGLGVFDFFVDVFKAKNRMLIGLATFLPPLILSVCSQNMYVHAMASAGYIAVFLEIIIPFCGQVATRYFLNLSPKDTTIERTFWNSKKYRSST